MSPWQSLNLASGLVSRATERDRAELLRDFCTARARTRRPEPADCSRGCVVQVLLEPVVGVSLVVERSDLPVTSRSVERDRFLERPVRLQSDRRAAQLDGPQFEFFQEPPSDAEPA